MLSGYYEVIYSLPSHGLGVKRPELLSAAGGKKRLSIFRNTQFSGEMSLCAAPSAPDDRFHDFAGIKNEPIGTVTGLSGRFVFFADPRVPSSAILQRQPITIPHVKKATEKIIANVHPGRFYSTAALSTLLLLSGCYRSHCCKKFALLV